MPPLFYVVSSFRSAAYTFRTGTRELLATTQWPLDHIGPWAAQAAAGFILSRWPEKHISQLGHPTVSVLEHYRAEQNLRPELPKHYYQNQLRFWTFLADLHSAYSTRPQSSTEQPAHERSSALSTDKDFYTYMSEHSLWEPIWRNLRPKLETYYHIVLFPPPQVPEKRLHWLLEQGVQVSFPAYSRGLARMVGVAERIQLESETSDCFVYELQHSSIRVLVFEPCAFSGSRFMRQTKRMPSLIYSCSLRLPDSSRAPHDANRIEHNVFVGSTPEEAWNQFAQGLGKVGNIEPQNLGSARRFAHHILVSKINPWRWLYKALTSFSL